MNAVTDLRPGGTEQGDVPLIAHVIYRLDYGGLENGLVNLLNNLPVGEFRHTVICLTDYTEFRDRIVRPDVTVHALHKPPGNSLTTHVRMYRLLRELRPAIVHSRNLAALECQVAAAMAGVPVRIHSEHGRDANDVDGSNWKYLTERRAIRPFVHHYIALSRDLERYLRDRIGVDSARLSQIYNGVDLTRFHPQPGGRRGPLPVAGFADDQSIVIGTVGRMDAVKDPVNLAEAFARLAQMIPEARARLRLVMIGDGAQRPAVEACLERHGLRDQAWLPGARDDVPAMLRALDVFVLPSLSEGISNTILEAMASGVPVVATDVGGNPELVAEGETGALVPRSDPDALARALLDQVRQPAVRLAQGRRALQVIQERFGLPVMVARYASIYRDMLAARGGQVPRGRRSGVGTAGT